MTRNQQERALDALQFMRETIREEQNGMSHSAYGSMAAVIENVESVLHEVDIVEFCSYTGDITYLKQAE